MRYFTFNGRDSRDLFPLTNSITRPYLPPVTVPSFSIPNKAGAVAIQRNEVGIREIEVEVTFMMDSWEDLRSRVRELASFLIYNEDKPLIFSDEPNLQYYARFNTSDTDLVEVAKMGRGTLSFTCFDPYAYELNESEFIMPTLTIEDSLFNNGTVEAFPRIRVAPTMDAQYLKITNVTTNEFMYYNFPVLTGSALIFDHSKNQVFDEATEENLIRNITLDSTFFSLVTGENVILIQNHNSDGSGVNQQSLQVYWRERFY